MEAQLEVIGLVVQDMPRALAFYRHLGLALPPEADGEPHVEVALAGGLRLAWDTVETIRSFDPEWTPAAGGHRIALAFRLPTPGDVDAAYARLTGSATPGTRRPGTRSGSSATPCCTIRTGTPSSSSPRSPAEASARRGEPRERRAGPGDGAVRRVRGRRGRSERGGQETR